ncbi:MAG: hypothetical protein KC431_28900, partial [Myxococcales bacterium]|nr:hypothetical protein [Myxococcales bacterium]
EIGDFEDGAIELERALELAPERFDLRRELVEAYERLDRPDLVVPQLDLLLRRVGSEGPAVRGPMVLRLAAALRENGDPASATEVLAGFGRELAGLDPALVGDELREAVAEQSFAGLRQLGEDERALLVALELAAKRMRAGEDGKVSVAGTTGLWLARAGRVLDEAGVESVGELLALAGHLALPPGLPADLPLTRAGLLTAALRARPDDVALAEELEHVLRELGDDEALEQHLRRQIERHGDPDTRAELIERLLPLIESTGATVAADRVEGSGELADLLEELLVLRPGHATAMLTLGRLRFEQGDATAARQLWAVAAGAVDDGDPRFYEPALELGREALDLGEFDHARTMAERARRLEPGAAEPVELLAAIAGAVGDPELMALTLEQLLETLDAEAPVADGDQRQVDRRSALELELAWALARWYEREASPDRARAALGHFEASLRAAGDAAARVAGIRRALALAEALDDAPAAGRMRALLRQELGAALSVPEILAEVELLDRRLDSPLVALERLEHALGARAAEAALLTGLEELLVRRSDRPELAQRAQRTLRS